MKLVNQAYLLLIFVLLTATSTVVAQIYAKPGCNDMCGDVRIPYPFGIGANCSINEWYAVDCNSSIPYLSALNNLQVLDINLSNQTVTLLSMISDCQNLIRNSTQILNADLGGSPFLFSRLHNKFVVEGCGNAVIFDHGIAITGCSTTCGNDTVSDRDNCLGVSCCQTTIPHNLESYTIDLTGMERQLGGDGVCGSAFLVDEGRFSRQFASGDNSYVPISLLWTLSYRDSPQIQCCTNAQQVRLKLGIGNGTSVVSWKCSFSRPNEGNPYLYGGCTDTQECSRCDANGGLCLYQQLYEDDGISGWNFTCLDNPTVLPYARKSSSFRLILGVTISIGVLLLVGIIFFLFKVIRKAKAKRQRKKFFKRLLLKQQEEADPSLVDKTILFSSRELAKATDYFNENRILGRGGQGTVYKGMLVDGRIVAVKKSKMVDDSQLEQFINEVVILSQVNHRNVVKLLGCCLDTEVPLLVSEFISNGTLYDRIHSEKNEFPMSFNMRLQIATEIAGALAYLHSATSIPIYHRDIKTTNILLDEKYRAKVSDFGTSRFVSLDQTHLTTLVKGTFGYLDPEYFQSSQFTEKSDVYSFGVVLVELLTGERAISLTRFGENRSLAVHFMLAVEEGSVMSILDTVVLKEATKDGLAVLANLAMRCLNMNGKNRPTMKEVAIDLETIRMSHVPSTLETNVGHVVYEEDFSMLTYGESTSTF